MDNTVAVAGCYSGSVQRAFALSFLVLLSAVLDGQLGVSRHLEVGRGGSGDGMARQIKSQISGQGTLAGQHNIAQKLVLAGSRQFRRVHSAGNTNTFVVIDAAALGLANGLVLRAGLDLCADFSARSQLRYGQGVGGGSQNTATRAGNHGTSRNLQICVGMSHIQGIGIGRRTQGAAGQHDLYGCHLSSGCSSFEINIVLVVDIHIGAGC